jgi:hypothetical protein
LGRFLQKIRFSSFYAGASKTVFLKNGPSSRKKLKPPKKNGRCREGWNREELAHKNVGAGKIEAPELADRGPC